MFCLIVAESAIFMIFVVAYLFYIGKSLTGPTPREVLEVPIFYHDLPAVEQPDDSPRRQGPSAGGHVDVSAAGGWRRSRSAPRSSTAPRREWHRLIYEDGLTISTNLFGTTYYSLVGLHGFHVTVGLILLSVVMAFTLARTA